MSQNSPEADAERRSEDADRQGAAESGAEAAGPPAGAEASAEDGEADGREKAGAAPVAPPEDPRDIQIRVLQRMLAEREATLHDYIKAHKRAEAEFEAFRGRLLEGQEREVERTRSKVVEGLLDVLDNLDRSIESVERGGSLAGLKDGVVLVARQFHQALGALGLSRVDPTGQLFDPASMEALHTVPVDDPAQDNIVVSTLKVGYTLGNREIRPALVQVGRKV